MLVHFFCLLEFKFMFEFICLNPSSKTQTLIPKPYPIYPTLFGPAARSSSSRSPAKPAQQPLCRLALQLARAAHQPLASAALHPSITLAAQLAFRPKPQPAHSPAPCVADGRGPHVIPPAAPSPTRTQPKTRRRRPSPPRARVLRVARTPKAVPRAI
jgi:hypothetical protein